MNNFRRQVYVGKWQYHLDYIQSSESFSGLEKKNIFDGLAKLREIFTDDWLWDAAENWHPLISYITNYAPWSQLWLADFGRRLNFIKDLPQIDKLHERLKNPNEYSGAEAEVDTIYKLKKSGFNIELYPKVGKRKADVKASLNNEEFYFEISRLQPSQKEIAASKTFDMLSFPYVISEQNVIMQYKIYKILSRPRINEFRKKIEDAILKVKENKEFIYIGEPGVIDCLIIHESNRGRLDNLLNQFGMKRGVFGPPISVDYVRRLDAKFWDEVEQLPKDKPSVIVIYGNLTYFSGNAKDFYNELAFEIEETIYEQSNLILGIIIGKENGTRDDHRSSETLNYIFNKTYQNDLLSQSTLIIKNRYSLFSVNQKIIDAFTQSL